MSVCVCDCVCLRVSLYVYVYVYVSASVSVCGMLCSVLTCVQTSPDELKFFFDLRVTNNPVPPAEPDDLALSGGGRSVLPVCQLCAVCVCVLRLCTVCRVGVVRDCMCVGAVCCVFCVVRCVWFVVRCECEYMSIFLSVSVRSSV